MFVEPLADRNLFVACSAGMCNRLLLLAGSMRIAEMTGRKLFFRWSTNGEAGGRFSDLFTNAIAPLTEVELLAMLRDGRRVVIYNNGEEDELYFRAMRRHRDPEAHVVMIKGSETPLFEGEQGNDPEVVRAVLRHLRSLVPVPEVEYEAGRFNLRGNVIGVHVRRGDHLEFFSESQDDHFIQIMRAVLKREPDTLFFLATDDLGCLGLFQKVFGDKILNYSKQWLSRATIVGMRDALVELLLLSRTRSIIGNARSSYTTMAARYGGKSLVIASRQSVKEMEQTVETLLGGCWINQKPLTV